MDQDLTFKANFSDEGLGKLKEGINEKLREFMGDYTDDTLVEYVIVLLRNGRKKDDTAKELHVFLGNDNIPFISWLWDHLSTNINLYIEQPEVNANLQKDPQDDKGQIAKRLKRDTQIKPDTEIGAEKRKRQKIVWEEREKKDERESRQKILWEEREKKEERERRQKIVWEEREKKEEREREKKRLPVRSMVSSVISSVHEGDYNNTNNNNYNNNNGSRTSRTRYQQNGTEQTKRPNQLDAAPRRLLQFAVRDAVLSPRTQQQQQPVFSRLRSVLASRSAHNQEENQELNKEEDEEIEEEMEEEVEEEIVDAAYNRTRSTVTPPAGGRIRSVVASRSVQRVEEEGGYGRGGSGVTAPAGSVFDRLGKGEMVISRGEMEEDCVSDNEGYDDDDHRMVEEYSSVQQEREPEKKQIQASQIANKPSKILNISVNVNTWKPAGTSVQTSQSHQFSLQNTPKSDQTKVLVPENIQRETPKAVSTPVASSYKATQTLEDPETRTLFVSNVHFAATKDALSRHFNKFGAVLKVIILIDPSTGQPTGSAYVEFLQKESAEAALSLNGTSFMSRILKVVRRNSSDATQMVPGYHPRTSSFPSRGQPSRRPAQLTPVLLRGGKPRNMQWKRGGTGTGANQPVPVQSPGARSFTYTRAPPKTE